MSHWPKVIRIFNSSCLETHPDCKIFKPIVENIFAEVSSYPENHSFSISGIPRTVLENQSGFPWILVL